MIMLQDLKERKYILIKSSMYFWSSELSKLYDFDDEKYFLCYIIYKLLHIKPQKQDQIWFIPLYNPAKKIP